MGKPRQWFTCEQPVMHKKTGKRGTLLKFTATSWAGGKQYQVKWDDGLTTWHPRREISQP